MCPVERHDLVNKYYITELLTVPSIGLRSMNINKRLNPVGPASKVSNPTSIHFETTQHIVFIPIYYPCSISRTCF